MGEVGRSQVRVDAYDKATGRTKYYEDQMPQDALYVRIKHAEIAHGFVKSVDTAAAEAIDGVVKVITCFDVPDIPFPTAGHPCSMDPGIWVEATTVILPFSSYAKQPWFSMWQCCTVGVSYQPSTLISPGS